MIPTSNEQLERAHAERVYAKFDQMHLSELTDTTLDFKERERAAGRLLLGHPDRFSVNGTRLLCSAAFQREDVTPAMHILGYILGSGEGKQFNFPFEDRPQVREQLALTIFWAANHRHPVIEAFGMSERTPDYWKLTPKAWRALFWDPNEQVRFALLNALRKQAFHCDSLGILEAMQEAGEHLFLPWWQQEVQAHHTEREPVHVDFKIQFSKLMQEIGERKAKLLNPKPAARYPEQNILMRMLERVLPRRWRIVPSIEQGELLVGETIPPSKRSGGVYRVVSVRKAAY